ncbi:MAG: ATP-binding protein [Treponema sp.]|nr:ATP-binding protein [Treponema sp.]
MNKKIWKNLEIKIGLMLLFVALSASVGIYYLNYTQFYSLTMSDLEQDAINLHGYAEEAIDIRIFSEINTIEDQQSELYINTQRQLDEIRRIANAKFLYTIKLNDNNEYIYLIDGLDKDDEFFSHAGMLVEDEYIADLDRNMNDEIVSSNGIMITDYGYLFSMSFPFHDYEGNVIGVIGIDYDSGHLYYSMNRARRMSIFFTLILGFVFAVFTLFTVKKVVKHTEKTFDKMIAEIKRRDETMQAVNQIASLLLTVDNNNNAHTLLIESLGIIGRAAYADRVHIWQNKMIDGCLHYVCTHSWFSEAEEKNAETFLNFKAAYNDKHLWKRKVMCGEYINNVFSEMPPDDKAYFRKHGASLKSAAIIPLFLEDQFWGMFSIDHCKIENKFNEDEIEILRSVGLMIVTEINRNNMREEIDTAYRHTKILLDRTPLCCQVWDKNVKKIECNEEAIRLFGFNDKQDFLKRSHELYPEYQSDGILSVEKAKMYVLQAFSEGDCGPFNWTYNMLDGTVMPAEVTLKRIKYEDEYVVAGYTRDLREHKKLMDKIQENTAQLKIAKEAAEQSSQAKSIFLSQMSHEIRTPMNAILGIAEIRLQNNDLSKEVENGFVKIYESGSLLLNIINDILDFAQIDAGNLEIAHEKYSFPSMINDVVQINRLRYDSKPIEFKLSVDENIPANLIGDELRIKQILNNLLSNAYKYTDAGEICFSISVEVNEENDDDNVKLAVTISDTGQGMTEEQLKSLYDAYSRFNLDVNSGINGTGLGMNITKRLIGAMDGKIDTESCVGKGTVVTVHLPQKRSGPQVCGSEIVEILQTFSFYNKLVSKKSKISYDQISDGRVLIVDDININLLIAEEMLKSYGLHIETADNGLEAVEKIKNNGNYDIVFMDHMMPVMDGIKATKILRETGYTHPIVALTANAVLGQEEMFLTNGFDAFIAKPIDSHILDQVVTRFIKNVKHLDESELLNKTIDFLKMEKIFILDAENAISVLEKLSKNISNLESKDLESYIITVHGIKSALAGIGEKALSDLAYKLEQAGKDRNFGIMASFTPELMEALSNLVKDFKSRETEEVWEVSREDIVFLHKKYDEIKTACEKYNVKTAKKALADLKQKAWPRRIANINEEISVNLLCGEFKKVLITIENYNEETKENRDENDFRS